MAEDLKSQLPKHKSDLEAAQKMIDLGWPAVEPVIGELLEWLQDYNWPIAKSLAPFLSSIGEPLVPYLRTILDTTDHDWKYWILELLVKKSREIANQVRDQLERLVSAPTPNEAAAELNLIAQDIIFSLGNKSTH